MRRSTVAKLLIVILAFLFTASLLFSLIGGGESDTESTGEGVTADQAEEQRETPTVELVTVTGIIDGDTIEVQYSDGSVERVRYIGINTPETGRPYAAEATAFNSSLVSGKTVTMEKDVSERDQYDRLLRYVFVGDMMVNAELVAQGYANAATYPPDVRYSDHFVNLEAQARDQGLGLWAP